MIKNNEQLSQTSSKRKFAFLFLAASTFFINIFVTATSSD